MEWDRVKQIFQAALDRAPEERTAYLREACGDDLNLRAEVDSLLAAHAEAGDFAERPAIQGLGASSVDEAPTIGRAELTIGADVGSYRIQARVGEGAPR